MHRSFRFVTDPVWEEFGISFETYLYQTSEYMALNANGDLVSFGIARSDQPELLAFVSFRLTEGKACSGMGKPFGSLDYSRTIDPETLDHFLVFVEEQLRARGAQQIELRLPALVYGTSEIGALQQVLQSRSYSQVASVSNHHIMVDNKSFEDGIHAMERRKLTKCQRNRLTAEKTSTDALSEIYYFIKGCREERGQMLSLSWAEMSGAVRALPEAYLLFQVTLDGVKTAAAIVVRVNQRILYNFYPASALKYQSYSPQVVLLDCIYKYAQSHRYEIVDLGTSIVDGKPKESLINFKERVGGISTPKTKYSKSL